MPRQAAGQQEAQAISSGISQVIRETVFDV
jgi:hypothetical protein